MSSPSLTNPHPYLSSLQSLASWRPESVPSSQCSNTPLVPRPSSSASGIRNLLVVHDFQGNYLPYETPFGAFPSKLPLPPYTAEYLALISSFAYFSHHTVSIPPAPWINTLHRSGVKCLGTFLLEPSSNSESGRLFERGSEGEFLFAMQLAKIAQTYGFDGWLVNIETPMPLAKWDPNTLQEWLEELGGAMKEDCVKRDVVWYDALNVLNRVGYQNALTLLNVPFFGKCDGMLTNYCWTPPLLSVSATLAKLLEREQDVFTGIDVFGRGSYGGGGFDVGLALDEISKHGISAALFAPGWTYENFSGKSFHSNERHFWVGSPSPVPKSSPPVSHYITPRPSGTKGFFYTSFSRGFGQSLYLRGVKIYHQPWIHVGVQSLLPIYHPAENDALQWRYSERAFTGSSALVFSVAESATSEGEVLQQKLFDLGIAVTNELKLRLAYQYLGGAVGMYWIVSPDASSTASTQVFRQHLSSLDVVDENRWHIASIPLSRMEETEATNGCVLTEIGVFYEPTKSMGSIGRIGSVERNRVELLRLGELCVTMSDSMEGGNLGTISTVVVKELDDDPGSRDSSGTESLNLEDALKELQMKQNGVAEKEEVHPAEGDTRGVRFEWRVYPSFTDASMRRRRIPGRWSEMTKEFSWFVVWKGCEMVGISSSTEWVWEDGVIGEIAEEEEDTWSVSGVTWDGRVLDDGRKRVEGKDKRIDVEVR